MGAVRGLALLAALLATLAARAPSQAIAPEGSDFHNGSSLPLEDEGAGRARLSRLSAALARADADAVAVELRGLRAEPRVELVPFGPRTDVPALDLAARMIVESGSRSVRDRAEADTRELVAVARRNRDIDALTDLATRGSAFSAAREAALDAARLMFERGSWWEAERLAARAGDLPDAARIAQRSRERGGAAEGDEAGPVAPAGQSWGRAGGVLIAADGDAEGAGPPTLADGGGRRLLVLDGRGVHAIDRDLGRFVDHELDWGAALPGGASGLLMAPAPRHWDAVAAGDLLLAPFNALFGPTRRWQAARRSARLIGLDPGPPVALRFETVLETDRSSSAALGPLTVSGPRVFAQLFRVGLETEVSLVCFDARDGRLLWETPLVRGAQVRRFASRQTKASLFSVDKRAREAQVVERDGIVYACTGHGVVAAVDGLTGRVRHTFRYDRIFSLDPGVYDPAFLYDTGGWQDEPARLFGDRLVVAPSDSRFLYVLALSPGPRGHLILDDPIERLDRQDLIELRPDPDGSDSPAVLATRRRTNRYGLVLLGPGGAVLDETPLLPVATRFDGRPLALDGHVLIPANDGVLDFDGSDLSQSPERIEQHPNAPPDVTAVFALQGGLVTLSPMIGPPSPPGYWYIQWFEPAP